MLKKLRLKFVLINMSIVTAMLMILFGLIYFMTKSNLETESISMMESVAENPFALENPGEDSDQIQMPYFTVLLNPMGELIATSGGYYDLSDEEFLEEIVDAVFSQTSQLGVLKEYGLRYYRSENTRTQYVVFADLSYENATLQDLVKTCAVIGVAAFFALLFASILLARWAVRPVETAWDRQKKFMADASHELKTPLTVITTNAELLQNPESGEETRELCAQNILTMSDQMRSLVEKLLEIARVDDGRENYPMTEVDFSEVATDACLPFEVMFFESGYRAKIEIEEGITCMGNAELLGQLLDVLLDNAGKYTVKGGSIRVTLARQGKKHCRLTVSSEGTPMTPEECEIIFERFYRGDAARSRTGSFGLGLSIAQSVASKHHGRIWAESSGGMNHFIVELPVSA